ncbi:MAG: hypothetical protein FJ276_00335 [Planctomycetes bacterium]|nr:hypothetical protein [Planctomycetota bacterium]
MCAHKTTASFRGRPRRGLKKRRLISAGQRRRLVLETLEPRQLLAADTELLLAAIEDSPTTSTNFGLLLVADIDRGIIAPWRAQAPGSGEGFSGLAFANADLLYASTSDPASELVHFASPFAGAEARRVPIGVSIGDLAVQPGTGTLYAIGSGAGGAGVLYTIDANSGTATVMGNTGTGNDGGLAFAPNGTLYFACWNTTLGRQELHTLNPSSGQILSTKLLKSPVEPIGAIIGLAVRADGTLVGCESQEGRLVTIDTQNGNASLVPMNRYPARGVLGDVAFRPPVPNQSLTGYYEGFLNGRGGYWADNTGGTRPGHWHFSSGRYLDGLINHTPRHGWYYGRFETSRGGGHYDTLFDHQGTLYSPEITISARGTSVLSFSYLLDTRADLNVDFVHVYVDDGVSTTRILAREDGSLPQTGRKMWRTATADLTDWAGETVVLQFFFDTGDIPVIDPEGWYVDDIQIVNVCSPSDPSPADISGYKWNDLDRDGVWDAGEPGLNGWRIYLDFNGNNRLDWTDHNGNGAWDPGEGDQWVDTANDGTHDGAFEFRGLAPDQYTVREVLQEGWKQSYPAETVTPPFEHTVPIDPPAHIRVNGRWETTEPANFGNYITDISGYKWNDLDRDGVWDANERGLNDWTIYLDLNDDNELTPGEPSFVTKYDGEHDGAFWFTGLDPGTYVVREVLREGWKQSYPAATVTPHFEHSVPIDPPAGLRVHGRWLQTEQPNFGNYITDISGYKWNDLDRDGVWDTSEPGLNGWTIYLDLNNNDRFDWTDADGDNVWDPGEGDQWTVTKYDGQHNGAFWFSGLAAGDYWVREVFESGWRQSYPYEDGLCIPCSDPCEHHVTIDPPAGQRVHGQWEVTESPNFGNFITDISGYKWDDLNRNGIWDRGEPGLNGWIIYLDSGNNRLDWTDADGDNVWDPGEGEQWTVTRNDCEHDGAFWFAGLAPGTYTIREVLPEGWKQSYPANTAAPPFEHVVTINPPAGQRVHGRWEVTEPPNFGNFITDISGYAWNDLDRDGIWDANEPGLNGWTIYLDLDNDNQLGPTDPFFVTRFDGEHDGAYWFAGLTPGTYTVREIYPLGWKQSYPAETVTPPFEHSVTINPPAGQRRHGRWQQAEAPNFGNFITDISGYKWDDRDRDGIWDKGEPGLNGRTIYLDLNSDNNLTPGEPFFVTRNDGEHDGAFWFAGLAPGTYTVREVFQEGWKQSYPADTVLPPFEHTVTIDPPAGVRVHGRWEVTEPPNFGNFITDISGYKWNDLDRDGVWDANEPGLNGWTVYLDLDNDNQLGPAEPFFVTRFDGEHDGAYWFAGLAPGTYTVREIYPLGWKQSYPAESVTPPFEHSVTINPPAGQRRHGRWQQAEAPNFGDFITDISGYKWNDLNRNGDWDAGEPGLNGWTVYLDLNNDNTLTPGEPSFVTRNDGQRDGAFWFTGQTAGTYTVREVLQQGWKQSYPAGAQTPHFEHTVVINPANNIRVHGEWEHTQPANFGNFITDISGYKWNDLDRDGVWDANEPGLNGWRVYLDVKDAENPDGDNQLDWTDHDGDGVWDPGEGEQWMDTRNDGEHDGAFWFAGLDPGTYTVREVFQEGWKQSYPAASVTPSFEHTVTINPAAGQRKHGRWQQTESPNFGNFITDISGYKWEDPDFDGIWEPTDGPGLNGWRIYIDLDNDDQLDWTDKNGNGVWDPGEGEQWMDTKNDGQHDGAFWFVGLAKETYTVREVLRDSLEQSYPAESVKPTFEHQVTIDPASGIRKHGRWQSSEAPNFGNGRDPELDITITGLKYEDGDGDGVIDADEAFLGGWTIRVFHDLACDKVLDPTDPRLAERATNSDGRYRFDIPLPSFPACLIVVEVLKDDEPPLMWKQTAPDPSQLAVPPPEPYGPRGYWRRIPAPGYVEDGVDFGNQRTDISGYKWDDVDADGLWDAGELGVNIFEICWANPGKGNVQCTLTKNDGRNDGAYWFYTGLPAGSLVEIREQPKEGWKNTYPGSGTHLVPVGTHGEFEVTQPPNFGNAKTRTSKRWFLSSSF